MLLVWTAMLYSDDPTVLVLTVPAFLLVMATKSRKYINSHPQPFSGVFNVPSIA